VCGYVIDVEVETLAIDVDVRIGIAVPIIAPVEVNALLVVVVLQVKEFAFLFCRGLRVAGFDAQYDQYHHKSQEISHVTNLNMFSRFAKSNV
jgi:hypothetical protein